MAATAVSILPCPEIITTGTSAWSFLICSSSCNPSSLLPCSQMSRNTRCGRRFAISASAESLSRAVLVLKPSSSRIPATRSRISASSSTIRMSFAIGHACPVSRLLRLRFLFHFWSAPPAPRFHTRLFHFDFRGVARHRKPQPHPGPARARSNVRGIVELDPAAMVFQNAAHNRQAEAGALFARRDVGFEQARPAYLWQADAVVDDIDHDVIVLARRNNLDTSLPQLVRRDGLDRFGCVLDDVGQGLRYQPPVELRPHRLVLDLRLHIDVGVVEPHQEKHR